MIGPGGTDSSPDGARTWPVLGDEGFHVLSISAAGGAAWAVGEQGGIGLQPAAGRLLPRRP